MRVGILPGKRETTEARNRRQLKPRCPARLRSASGNRLVAGGEHLETVPGRKDRGVVARPFGTRPKPLPTFLLKPEPENPTNALANRASRRVIGLRPNRAAPPGLTPVTYEAHVAEVP